MAFLDATSAFDTVQHPALTAAFAAIGAAPSFVRWIKFIVTGHRPVIRTAYSMGDQASEFALESGTPQGDPLSPLLWATVVDFALRHAHTSGAPGFQIGRRTPKPRNYYTPKLRRISLIRACATPWADTRAPCRTWLARSRRR